MKRSGPLPRGKRLARSGRIKPRNNKRRAESYAQDFGEESEAIRAMPCLCRNIGPVIRCQGATEPAHNPSRGAGGGRFDQTPLCEWHHAEQHRIGVKSFQLKYGLDLRAEADHIALEHIGGLGLRPIAVHWATRTASKYGPVELDPYERSALFGWVRRRMEREAARRSVLLDARRFDAQGCGYIARTPSADAAARCLASSGLLRETWLGDDDDAPEGVRDVRGWVLTRAGLEHLDGLPDDDREALAHAVMLDLGEPVTSDTAGEHGLAWTLCEAAGWPEVNRG